MSMFQTLSAGNTVHEVPGTGPRDTEPCGAATTEEGSAATRSASTATTGTNPLGFIMFGYRADTGQNLTT